MTDSSAQRHPVVVSEARRRLDDVQLRIADGITAFAGSMNFVYHYIGGPPGPLTEIIGAFQLRDMNEAARTSRI
jgi:hypothetical protein